MYFMYFTDSILSLEWIKLVVTGFIWKKALVDLPGGCSEVSSSFGHGRLLHRGSGLAEGLMQYSLLPLWDRSDSIREHIVFDCSPALFITICQLQQRPHDIVSKYKACSNKCNSCHSWSHCLQAVAGSVILIHCHDPVLWWRHHDGSFLSQDG